MKRGLIVGIILWLVVTAATRLWSDTLLPNNAAVFAIAFLYCGPLAMAVGFLLRYFACPPGIAAHFGIGVAISGMLLGAATMLMFGEIFPDSTPFTRGHYGTLILWCNGIILLVIALSVPKPPRP